MKNKFSFFIINILIIFLFINTKNVFAENIEFKAKKIFTFDNLELIVGEQDTEVDIGDRIKIFADKYSYYKNKNLIIVEGNIKLINFIDDIILNSQLIHYNILDKEIISYEKTEADIKKKYNIQSKDVYYNYIEKKIFSKKEIVILDKFKNKITSTNYKYLIDEEIVKGNNLKLIDDENNKYYLNNGMIDLKNNLILGQDINVYLKNDTFGNKDNKPRLIGNSVSYKDNLTTVNKGIFTSCNNEEKNCTPWSISSNKIVHDKTNKEVRYSDSVLRIYDIPVAYFPKFFHPDPSVRRKSGFLSPSMNGSNNLGTSIIIPYYHVISNDSDLTFQPRLFSNNELLLRNEYRKETKKSSNIIDFSINKSDNDKKQGTRSHLFANSQLDLTLSTFDESKLFIKLEKVSNDDYTREYSLDNNDSIVNDTSVLESVIQFSGAKNEFYFDLAFESYETMYLANNDRYEFIYPNYSLSKIFKSKKNSLINNYIVNSYGSQKKKETNVYEAEQINDFLINSNFFKNKIGLTNNFEFMFKNVNSLGKNSSKFKDNEQSEFLSQIIYNLSLPLIKNNDEKTSFLTPKLSFRHSPNDTKNFSNELKYINSDNIFSLNRIGTNQGVEGGSSITLGANYNLTENQNNNDLISANIATSFRNKIDKNIPLSTTLGEKQSDIVGNINISLNQLINLKYDYSLDSNMNDINLHNLKNRFTLNNFIYDFNFFEENNIIGNESYYENSLIYKFNENKSLIFKSRENKKTNLTEFYNLIYEYKNDCLTAAIKYNKDYYSNGSLKPNEELFFLINLIPLGSTQSENIINVN